MSKALYSSSSGVILPCDQIGPRWAWKFYSVVTLHFQLSAIPQHLHIRGALSPHSSHLQQQNGVTCYTILGLYCEKKASFWFWPNLSLRDVLCIWTSGVRLSQYSCSFSLWQSNSFLYVLVVLGRSLCLFSIDRTVLVSFCIISISFRILLQKMNQ